MQELPTKESGWNKASEVGKDGALERLWQDIVVGCLVAMETTTSTVLTPNPPVVSINLVVCWEKTNLHG